jgi:Protein of unknown function (DUF1553)/Protein of unknown function (DUF1549)/Planctomycete cytochrome C
MKPTLLLLGLLVLPPAPARGADAKGVDFGREVLPILSDNCFRCHGPDATARKGKLRLDVHAGALRVIVPGKSGESELYRRVVSAEPREVMPPPKATKKLTANQIDTLRRWIDEGATWGQHWAFVAPKRPSIPQTRNPNPETRNPIDSFIVSRLEREQLRPSPEADRLTLLRRVTLDLTGLPPTPEEVARARNDKQEGWYERVVERLLASPHYGERMVWEWLDAARYADSNGYQGDGERTMWPWRDWAVDALNSNLPFDQFTIQQLAGDLLPNATTEQKLATGFNRNHMINGEGGRIAEENRVDYVMDMAETTGTVWLGLTFNCCRCHDHKFDPLTMREYYGLFAFFNQTPVNGGGGNPATPPIIEITPRNHSAKVKVMVMEDLPKRRDTFMYVRGSYEKPGEKVEAIFPAALGSAKPQAANRLDLARWLVSPENPLTARVTVNRVWQQFFGTGLVKTSEDFGVQGEKPSHPELLDWLAVEFQRAWDMKALHRLIVTSATYRQSSKVTPTLLERDPSNRLLARGPRFRLPSWMIRDQALAASGLLVRTMGGPPVKPYQPSGVWEEATFGRKRYQQDKGEALYRRSVYTFWRRIIGPTPFFDATARQVCIVKPTRTNSPLHALTTLNDVTFVEAARVLAERVLTLGGTPEERVERAFQRVLARKPTKPERDVLLACVSRSRREFANDAAAAKKLLAVGDSKRDEKLDAVEHAAYTAVCLAILNLDETLTKE